MDHTAGTPHETKVRVPWNDCTVSPCSAAELALSEGIESELKELLTDREGEGGSIPWRFAEEGELEIEEEEEDNTQVSDKDA